MSIYQPSVFSGLAQTGSGILGSVGSGLAGALGNAVAGALGGGVVGSIANGAINYGANIAIGKVAQNINNLGFKADQRLEQFLTTNLTDLGLGAYGSSNADNNALLFAGGLSLKEMRQIIELADGKNLSHSNFFLLEISDPYGNGATEGIQPHLSKFNLFTQSLDLNPIETTGDPIQIGSATVNIPTQSGLTEMNLTVLDDRYGTIKRWAKQKQAMSTPSDGSVMPAVYRTFAVRIIYGTNKAYDDFYNERYTMELAGTQIQLSRTDQGLETISIRLTQESTFMPTRY